MRAELKRQANDARDVGGWYGQNLNSGRGVWPLGLAVLKHQAYAHDIGRLGKQSGKKRQSLDDHDVGCVCGHCSFAKPLMLMMLGPRCGQTCNARPRVLMLSAIGVSNVWRAAHSSSATSEVHT